jgi:hypothetical protein
MHADVATITFTPAALVGARKHSMLPANIKNTISLSLGKENVCSPEPLIGTVKHTTLPENTCKYQKTQHAPSKYQKAPHSLQTPQNAPCKYQKTQHAPCKYQKTRMLPANTTPRSTQIPETQPFPVIPEKRTTTPCKYQKTYHAPCKYQKTHHAPCKYTPTFPANARKHTTPEPLSTARIHNKDSKLAHMQHGHRKFVNTVDPR